MTTLLRHYVLHSDGLATCMSLAPTPSDSQPETVETGRAHTFSAHPRHTRLTRWSSWALVISAGVLVLYVAAYFAFREFEMGRAGLVIITYPRAIRYYACSSEAAWVVDDGRRHPWTPSQQLAIGADVVWRFSEAQTRSSSFVYAQFGRFWQLMYPLEHVELHARGCRVWHDGSLAERASAIADETGGTATPVGPYLLADIPIGQPALLRRVGLKYSDADEVTESITLPHDIRYPGWFPMDTASAVARSKGLSLSFRSGSFVVLSIETQRSVVIAERRE